MRRNLSTTRVRTGILAALVMLLAAGCTDGQLVDAGGERGQGGLAFEDATTAFFEANPAAYDEYEAEQRDYR